MSVIDLAANGLPLRALPPPFSLPMLNASL
jgi:hypothetical protein